MAYSHGANNSPIDLENFELVGVSPIGGVRFDTYVGRSRLGNEIPATNQQRNKREEVVATFRAILPNGSAPQVTLGGDGSEYDGYVATRVEVDQVNTEDGTVRVTLHKNDGNSNEHSEQKSVVTLPSTGYGITATPLTGGSPATNCIRMSFSAAMEHRDRQDRLGDHLYGFSYGCRLECSQEYVDDEGAISAAAGWFIDEDLPAEENTDARTRVVRGHSFNAVT